MYPTADQVARALIAAFEAVGMRDDLRQNPKLVLVYPMPPATERGDKIKHARGYATFALRRAFPDCPSPAIGRMVGARSPGNYVGTMIAYRAKGMLRWHDPEIEARIAAAIGEQPPEPAEEAQETPPAPPVPIQRAPAANAPAPYIPVRAGPDKSGSRRRLEEELRQAVLNTGGRLVK